MAFSETDYDTLNWEDRALRRSLRHAHARSRDQMQRLVGAARELANETGSAAFTVNQVAKRANLSLKSFYRCFAGKDELLLALLEEESRMGAALLADAIARHRDPVERLRAYVEDLFEMLTHPAAVGYAGLLVREHRRLSEEHPEELRAALSALVGLLATELEAAGAAGRTDVHDVRRTAATVFGVLLGGISDVTAGLADPRELGAWLWRFCWSGMQPATSIQGGHT